MFHKLATMACFAVSTNAIKYLNVGGCIHASKQKIEQRLNVLEVLKAAHYQETLTTSGLVFSMPACRKRFIHKYCCWIIPLHHPEVALHRPLINCLIYILPVITNNNADIYMCF